MLRPSEAGRRWAMNQDEVVWATCAGVPVIDCKRCPHMEDDPQFGPCQRACRGLAEEVVAIVYDAAMGRTR